MANRHSLAGRIISGLLLPLVLQMPVAFADSFVDCVAESDSWTLNWEVVGLVEKAQLANGVLNPGNLLAQLPSRSALYEIRPDARFECSQLLLAVSPRYQVQRTEVEDSMQLDPPETSIDRSEFINEATLRLNVGEYWSVEASRQALLWGPSLFFSPSNPFTRDNGRNTPYLELPGQDFMIARAFVGDSSVLTFIDNFDAGVAENRAFEETYAITYEYTAQQWTGTLVFSQGEHQVLAGGYAQHTVTDAVILFTDIGVRKVKSSGEAGFQNSITTELQVDDDTWLTSLTLGAAYSFQDGSNISAEYFYNQPGLSDAQYEKLLTVGERLDRQVSGGVTEPIEFGTDIATVGQVVLVHPVGLRQHYLALQFNKNEIVPYLDAVVRWTYGADDGSSLLVLDLNAAVSDYCRIFLTLLGTNGNDQNEFKQFYDNRMTLGTTLLF